MGLKRACEAARQCGASNIPLLVTGFTTSWKPGTSASGRRTALQSTVIFAAVYSCASQRTKAKAASRRAE